MENDLEIWEMAKIYGKWLRCMGHGLSILRISLTIFEMAEEFDKGLKYVRNDVYLWELAWVFEKRLKHVGNDVDLWEMAQICGEMT